EVPVAAEVRILARERAASALLRAVLGAVLGALVAVLVPFVLLAVATIGTVHVAGAVVAFLAARDLPVAADGHADRAVGREAAQRQLVVGFRRVTVRT